MDDSKSQPSARAVSARHVSPPFIAALCVIVGMSFMTFIFMSVDFSLPAATGLGGTAIGVIGPLMFMAVKRLFDSELPTPPTDDDGEGA